VQRGHEFAAREVARRAKDDDVGRFWICMFHCFYTVSRCSQAAVNPAGPPPMVMRL
jgi:hypothetical protein